MQLWVRHRVSGSQRPVHAAVVLSIKRYFMHFGVPWQQLLCTPHRLQTNGLGQPELSSHSSLESFHHRQPAVWGVSYLQQLRLDLLAEPELVLATEDLFDQC